jgi:hypothetical protein
VVEKVAANPAEQCLAQLRVVVGPCHDHVGTQIGGARQQYVGDRDVTAWALFWLCFDPVPLQVPYHAFEPRPLTVQIGFMTSDIHHGDRLGIADKRQRVMKRPVGLAR